MCQALRRTQKAVIALCVAVLVFAPAGCGDSSDLPADAGAPTAESRRERGSTGGGVASAPSAPTGPTAAADGESAPGGTGDEEAIRTPVDLFVVDRTLVAGASGAARRRFPDDFHVPAAIAIELTLRSLDGGDAGYELIVDGPTGRIRLRVGGSTAAADLMLDGLRAGESYRFRLDGEGESGLIVADAEPGP